MSVVQRLLAEMAVEEEDDQGQGRGWRDDRMQLRLPQAQDARS